MASMAASELDFQPRAYVWVLSRTNPPGERLLIVAAFDGPGGSPGILRPAFLTPEGHVVADPTAYAVQHPQQVQEFLSALCLSRPLGSGSFLLAGPYTVDGSELPPDQLPLALERVLRQVALDQGAHARLDPRGVYEALTPKEHLVWRGVPSAKPGHVDVELYYASAPGFPPRLVAREAQLPVETAERIMLDLEYRKLSAYLEVWRPLGHRDLEGPLGPLVRIS